jgi:DNA-binding NtrC family response regulator
LYIVTPRPGWIWYVSATMPQDKIETGSTQAEATTTLYRNGRLAESISVAEASGLSDPETRLIHANALYETGSVIKALGLLSQLCDELRKRPDVERFAAEFSRFNRESNFQSPAETVTGLGRLRQLATTIGDAPSLAGLHLAVARIEALRGLGSDARAHLDIARRLATGQQSLLCSIELVSASPFIYGGSIELAKRSAIVGFERASSGLLQRSLAGSLANMGLFALYGGESERARNYLNQARSAAGEFVFVQLAVVESLACVELFEGNLTCGRKYLDEANVLIRALQVPARSWYDLAIQITQCQYLGLTNDWHSIVEIVGAAEPELERRQLRVWHASLLSAKAKALAHLGRHDEAGHTLVTALQLCPPGAIDPLISVEAATGTCLTLRGDTARGAHHFNRALRACQAISHRFHEWAVTKERDSVESQRRQSVAGAAPKRNDTDETGLILADVSTLLSAGHSIDVMAQRLSAIIGTTSMRPRFTLSNGEPASIPVTWDSASDGTQRISLSDADRGLILTVQDVHLLEEMSLLRTLVELAKIAVAQSGDRRQQDDDLLWPQMLLPTGGDAVFWSPRMQELLRLALKFAVSDVPILITGETGTGKEVIAKLIHAGSKWSRGPFVPYNSATVPRDLVESQLFGHRKGSFTGAQDSQLGLIRAAERGTLFLDEIGDLDVAVQPKLLRFLESGEVHPLGDPRPIQTRVRVVAATNANLETLVSQGRFRSDLFYRLRVATLQLPPLRERKDEIPALAATFVRKACKELGRRNISVGADFIAALLLHEWPGNIRQLSNEVRRAIIVADDGATLTAQDLSPEIAEGWVSRRPEQPKAPAPPAVAVRLDQPLEQAVEDVERAFVQRALQHTQGRISEAAELLGISRKGLFLKRKKLGLD